MQHLERSYLRTSYHKQAMITHPMLQSIARITVRYTPFKNQLEKSLALSQASKLTHEDVRHTILTYKLPSMCVLLQ